MEKEVSTPASAPSAVEWNRSVAAILLARHREFAQNGNANKSHTLLKVVECLREYPLPIQTGEELKAYRGIGAWASDELDVAIRTCLLHRLAADAAAGSLLPTKREGEVPATQSAGFLDLTLEDEAEGSEATTSSNPQAGEEEEDVYEIPPPPSAAASPSPTRRRGSSTPTPNSHRKSTTTTPSVPRQQASHTAVTGASDTLFVSDWLQMLGYPQYADQLAHNGFARPLELQFLTAEELDAMGITLLGHRRVILHAVEILRKELAQMPAAPMPVAASPPSSSRGSSARTLSFSSPSALPGSHSAPVSPRVAANPPVSSAVNSAPAGGSTKRPRRNASLPNLPAVVCADAAAAASNPQTDSPHAKRLRTTAAAPSPSSKMPERLRGATDIKELFPKYLEVYAPDGGSVQRGLAYYLAGAVVMRRELPDRRIEFRVLGQHEDSYRVIFDFGPNYKRAECLCARQTSASRHQRGWCKHIIACLATVVCDSVTAPEWVRRMPGANEVIALVSFDFIARCNNYARSEESATQVSAQQQQQQQPAETAVEELIPSSCAAVVGEAASPVRRPALVGSASPPPPSPLSPPPTGKQVYRPNAFTGPCALLIALHLLRQEGYTSAGPLELFPIMKLYSPRIGPSPQCVWNIVKACVKKGAVAILDEGTQRCGLTESGCAAALEAVDSDRQRRSREAVPLPVVPASLLSPARQEASPAAQELVRAASAPALFPTSSAPLPSFATPSPLSSASASSPHRTASPPAAQSYPASLFAVSGTGGAAQPALSAVDSMETTTEKPDSDHMETRPFVSTCTTPSAGNGAFTSTSTSSSTAEGPIPGTSTSTSSSAARGSEASPYREARRAAVSAEEFKRDWEVVLITDSAEAEGITKRVWEHFTERQEYLRERGIAIDRRGLALGDYIWVARKRQHPCGMPSDPRDDIVLDWIMERKTIRDLRASLHDMRLDDQYQRLKSSRLNTVFLLEQPFTTNPELTRESFDAIIDFFLMEIESQPRGRDNLFVEHVLSQDETAAYVWRMTKRLRRHYDQHGLDGTEYSFRAFQKAFKKGNFRQSELGTLASMLLCVPGMSHTEAIAIARANPTPTGLVDTLHHFEEQQQQQGLEADVMLALLEERKAEEKRIL